MNIDVYLGTMKLKETGKDRILGFYKNSIGWNMIQGDTVEQFVNNTKKTIINNEILFHAEYIKYFENLTPIPKIIDEIKYKEIREIYSKIAHKLANN